MYAKGSFIVIQWNATGILNGIVKFFLDCIQKGILKVCQRFTKGLLKICLWSIHWYIKVYGIYNEAIDIHCRLKIADQDIILTLSHQKHRHIQNVGIWCSEKNTV